MGDSGGGRVRGGYFSLVFAFGFPGQFVLAVVLKLAKEVGKLGKGKRMSDFETFEACGFFFFFFKRIGVVNMMSK